MIGLITELLEENEHAGPAFLFAFPVTTLTVSMASTTFGMISSIVPSGN